MADLTWQHKGETITINDSGVFRTSLNDRIGDEYQGYASRKEAENAIDRVLAAQAKEAREDIALAALSQEGISCVITGLRRGSGSLLYTPKEHSKGFRISPDYPDTPSVRTLLARKAALDKESAKIFASLRSCNIGGPYGGNYSQKDDAGYPAAIAKLKADYAKALAAAEALTLDEPPPTVAAKEA